MVSDVCRVQHLKYFLACKLNLRLVPPKDDVRSAKTTFLVTGISGW
jgi:hypothetical protein